MRTQFLLPVFVLSSLLALSCGSKQSGDSGDGNTDDRPVIDPVLPLTPAECEDAWSRYVSSRPVGLVLNYENKTVGTTTQSSIEVVRSDLDAVSESRRSEGGSTQTTTTKDQWLQSCTGTQGDSARIPVNAVIEAQGKETKTTRAGTFTTNYLKIRTTQAIGDKTNVSVNETWTNDETRGSFIVFSKFTLTTEANTIESTTELISIIRP